MLFLGESGSEKGARTSGNGVLGIPRGIPRCIRKYRVDASLETIQPLDGLDSNIILAIFFD